MRLKVLDIFSGIGAYSLGLERAGMETVAFCESNTFCQRILRKHWPDVPIYDDVRTLTADALQRDGITADVIVGGWPCQDLSPAGTRRGLDGERSGLWSEVARLLGEIPSAYAILENSSNILSLDGGRWFSRVLGDLAALRRNAEWHCLSAAGFDAPHIRDRLWIIAGLPDAGVPRLSLSECEALERAGRGREGRATSELCSASFANADDQRELQSEGLKPYERRWTDNGARQARNASDAYGYAPVGAAIARQERVSWTAEPDVVRVVHGVADRVDRIKALGNCNPPIIPELIGRAIMGLHKSQTERS